MTAPANDSSDDSRLNEIIAAYLAAVDGGHEPDQQELLHQHPDLAAELAAFFADRDAFQRLAPPGPPAHPAHSADLPTIGPSEQAALAPGVKVRYFGDYELLEEIARGGMGVVYKAQQLSLNRLVALKMILAGQLASEADVQRFHIEAEAAAHLDHPNIVPIHEVGEHEGNHYYAMQFVDGPSLARHLVTTTWSNRDAAELVRVCAGAVQYAHERGVIHRDLKPANILLVLTGRSQTAEGDAAPVPLVARPLDDHTPKLTDFGLAKRVGHGVSLTATGQIVGTPSYMAPEQASSQKDVGPAADIYALGAILYELLTSQPPFRAATPLDTVLQVVSDEPVPPSQRQPKVPRDLETICLKCLEKRPERRYGSAAALANDLGRFLNHEPIQARPASRMRRFGVWVRKRPWTMVVLALVVILALSLLAQSFYLDNRRHGLDNLVREAQIARLSLAQQSAPEGGPDGPLRPGAEHALQSLRRAARLRPQGRLYDEALDLMLVEHRGGERVYPKPGGRAELPSAWVRDDQEFPWPFALTRDGKLLQVAGVLFHLDTGTTTHFEGPSALQTWCDPTGTLLERRLQPTGLEVVERANGALRLRLEPEPPLRVWTTRFSEDARLLAVVLGERGKPFSDWNTREIDVWPTRALEVWDVSAGRRLTSIPLQDSLPTRPEFSGDARLVAWCANDGIRVYVAATGEFISLIEAPKYANAALSPDGAALAWSTGISGQTRDTKVTVVRLPGGERIHELVSAGPVAIVRLAYTPDGQFIIGQTGFRKKDYIYSSFGLHDPGRAPLFQEQTDRVCIWDATDGRLLVQVRGRAFADGFGPHGELAVARANGSGAEAYLEIDLWRPGELVRALDQEAVSNWVYI